MCVLSDCVVKIETGSSFTTIIDQESCRLNSLKVPINGLGLSCLQVLLAQRSFWPTILSVCRLSVCLLSVTFCIVVKRYVLAKNCLKERIGNQGRLGGRKGRQSDDRQTDDTLCQKQRNKKTAEPAVRGTQVRKVKQSL